MFSRHLWSKNKFSETVNEKIPEHDDQIISDTACLRKYTYISLLECL